MSEESRQHHRSGDSSNTFVEHVRAADSGLALGRRWVEIVILLIGFGVTIGMNYQKFSTLSDKVDALGVRLEATDKKASDANLNAAVALRLIDEYKQDKEIDRLEKENWRATFKAIAMIQQQGGGKVTLQIPERPRDLRDGGR